VKLLLNGSHLKSQAVRPQHHYGDDDHDSIEQKPIYVIFEGSKPEVYISFKEIIGQKVSAKYIGDVSWKKYINIDEALAQARRILGVNYYMEPAAKEYI
jgi:hypothetical protein